MDVQQFLNAPVRDVIRFATETERTMMTKYLSDGRGGSVAVVVATGENAERLLSLMKNWAEEANVPVRESRVPSVAS